MHNRGQLFGLGLSTTAAILAWQRTASGGAGSLTDHQVGEGDAREVTIDLTFAEVDGDAQSDDGHAPVAEEDAPYTPLRNSSRRLEF